MAMANDTEDRLAGYCVPHQYVNSLLDQQFEIARASGLTPAAANVDRTRVDKIFDQSQVFPWAALKAKQRKELDIPVAGAQNPYVPLKDPYEIRVLELAPRSLDGSLHCTLHHCTIEFEQEGSLFSQFALSIDCLTTPIWYTALSYRWGDPQPVKHITVDGFRMEVTVPLFEAMNSFQQPNHSVMVWIDQICINQNDRNEKSRQIPLMGRIYRHAINTLIWLGDSTSGTGEVFRLLNHAATELMFDFSQLQIPDGLEYRGFPPKEHLGKSWKDLWDFLDRPWFSRLWIIQEVALSRNAWVMCGKHLMSWSMLETACANLKAAGVSQWLLEQLSKNKKGANHCERVIQLGTFAENESMMLLDKARESDCWDKRDKIYGLLGLIRASWIKVDYDRKHTVGRLYRDVIVECLRRQERALATVLKSVDHDYSRVLGSVEDCEYFERGTLPSWVPDWSQPRQTAPLTDSTGVYGNPETVRVDFNLQKDISIHDQELHVNGKIFATVVEITDVLEDPDISYVDPQVTNQKFLVGCADKAAQILEYPGSVTTSVFEAFWRTLVVDKDAENLKRAPPSFAEIFSLLLDESTGRKPSLPGQTYSPRQLRPTGKGRLELSSLSSRLPGATFQWIRSAVRRAAMNRRFAITKQGYFGLVPYWAKIGDEICVLNGCDVPYCIRRIDSEGFGKGEVGLGRFHFLGECYIHGVMNREILTSEELKTQQLIFV